MNLNESTKKASDERVLNPEAQTPLEAEEAQGQAEGTPTGVGVIEIAAAEEEAAENESAKARRQAELREAYEIDGVASIIFDEDGNPVAPALDEAMAIKIVGAMYHTRKTLQRLDAEYCAETDALTAQMRELTERFAAVSAPYTRRLRDLEAMWLPKLEEFAFSVVGHKAKERYFDTLRARMGFKKKGGTFSGTIVNQKAVQAALAEAKLESVIQAGYVVDPFVQWGDLKKVLGTTKNGKPIIKGVGVELPGVELTIDPQYDAFYIEYHDEKKKGAKAK